MTGLIVKSAQRFLLWWTARGDSSEVPAAWGKFRYEKVTPLVGDRVEHFAYGNPGEGAEAGSNFATQESVSSAHCAGEHLPVHQLGEAHPGGGALHQPLDVVWRKINFLPGGIPQAADLHQPCAVRYIVRQLGGFCAAAQVKDEPQPQPVQPGAVGFGGQPPGGETPALRPHFTVLPSSAR